MNMNRNQMGNLEDETPIVIVSNGCQKQGRGRFGLLLMTIFAVLLTPFLGWGQTSGDYSGIYYIGSVGYDADNPSNNYYLCPTEEWCYYAPVDDFTGTDNGKPFLTTYRCKTNDYHSGDSRDAVWTIEKDLNSGYYYIKQTSTGKYLLSNGQINTSNNADRMRVHLGMPDDPNVPDDEELETRGLFDITPFNGYLVISPQDPGIPANHKWLVVNGGNKLSLKGESGKTGGPTGYVNTAGIVGIYTKDDTNAPFYLEPATVAPPTITNNFDGTISITAETGATIYYTIDDTEPTTSSPVYSTAITLADAITVVKAIAKADSDYFPSLVSTYHIPVCERPVITVSNSLATITCNTEGASIYYTTDGTPATPSSTPYANPFNAEGLNVISAIATSPGYVISNVAFYYPPVEVSSSDEITNMNGRYILLDGFTSSAPIGTANEPFQGQIDGNYVPFSLNGHALVGVAEDAVIKNIVVSSVSYSGSGNVGAIINTAKGSTKVYNCGVQGGNVSGGTNTGGLVGLIEEGSSVRVVNCYNFANVSGSGYAAGIVGKNEGTVSSDGTVGNVRIALCMMYGNVTGATHISPVYCGNHEDNVSKFTEYNYWRYRSGLQYTALNDQLPIDEDEYLTRFPFFRHILNSHREMAAFFLFGGSMCNDVDDITDDDIAEIGHWALKKDVAVYPIIESWPKNTQTTPTSTNNNLPSTTDDYAGKLLTEMGTNGYLSVSVKIGTNTYSVSLPITDMDTLSYDFTWGKVVLPFANEFEVNTDYSRICTGWKITDITGGNGASYEHYNVSDRDCTTKDLFSITGFIFAQGGNYVVPYGVTGIEITANYATAYYLCDENYEIAYGGYGTANNNTAAAAGYKERTGLAGTTPNSFHGQTVHHTLNAALGQMTNSGSVHEQAVVLIGNYHWDGETVPTGSLKKGYTIMSIDADNNQEPDYALYSNNTQDRPPVPPTRYDFLAQIPLGMSSHLHGSVHYPNIPIYKPHGWFEITETSISRAAQFEIESNNFDSSDGDTRNYRCIINGGYYTQMVRSRANPCTKLSYYQIGGKAYIKEFYPGNHSAESKTNTLVPVNVTGGEIEQCFMTGYGQGKAYGPDIYFWCAGGRIHKFLGAYMEPPVQTSSNTGNNPGTVNLTAKIDHARIYRFFGGGTTSKARITGHINVTINNSFVDFYCGGPEFGDMEQGKTVTTTADHTTFREYYGAGFGGTAISYTNDKDETLRFNNPSVLPPGSTDLPYPSGYFNSCFLNTSNTVGRLDYKEGYGIGNCYKYEYILHSRGFASVARFYTGYAMFSLAKTGSVTNTLTNCTVMRSFYGGGCQGTVDGTVTSTLTDCTILQSAFGGGYKAESNQLEVYSATQTSPLSTYYGESSVFSPFGPIPPSSETYTWVQGVNGQSNVAVEAEHKLYTGTNVTLTDLGNVTGDITITLNGNTTVNGSVFGGGHESKSLSNTLVEILDHTNVGGNVYGGGNLGEVGGHTKVVVNGQVDSSGRSTGSSTNPTND